MDENIKAHELAKNQREISISEFFLKNRHLLGFDNPTRALLMTVKEAVDNAIDAADEMNVLPEIKVEVKEVAEDRYQVIVEDNGPGIVKQQIPNVFGRLLYGSKFFSRKQNRGQQGLGISVSVLYCQLTTGKATKVISKIGPKKPANYYEIQINTQKNLPEILKEDIVDWQKDHGTKIELELEARYAKTKQSVDEYLKQTAIANPHATIIYIDPDKKKKEFPRATNKLPIKPKEIKPHPQGIELGTLISMLRTTKARTIQSFLTTDFCRIGPKIAKWICDKANIPNNTRPSRIAKQEVETLFKALQAAKVIAPPTDCLSPIGPDLLEKGLKKEIDAEFFVTLTRSPSVYRGFPFQIECGIAYGGGLEKESTSRLLRFANRVPLLYQQGACAITEAVSQIYWKPYGLQQTLGNLPSGPALVVVHIASIWVPFTSEAKEAIAEYPEIVKEVKLALQECGRKLSIYINKKTRAHIEAEKKSYIEKYLPHIGIALREILKLDQKEEEKTVKILKQTLEESRSKE